MRDKIGHALFTALTVLWYGIVVILYGHLSPNPALQWLLLIFSGWVTFTLLVEGTQFENLVNKFTLGGIGFWKSVSMAFKISWEDTKQDAFLWNFWGALLGACLLSLVLP